MFASICIKTKYITQKHDNKPVCAGLWAWTAGGRRRRLVYCSSGKISNILWGEGWWDHLPFFDLAVLMERSARSQSRKTCQSNVTRWGLG
jgi:hypothetical protein